LPVSMSPPSITRTTIGAAGPHGDGCGASAPGQSEDAVGHSQRSSRYQSGDGRASVAGLWHHRGKLAELAGAVRPMARRTELEEAARDQALGRLIMVSGSAPPNVAAEPRRARTRWSRARHARAARAASAPAAGYESMVTTWLEDVGSGNGRPSSRRPSMWNSMASRISASTST